MNIHDISGIIGGKGVSETLASLASAYPSQVIFTTSFGIEDQMLTDIIFRNNIPVRVVTLDTGRMFEATYKVWSNTLKIYNKPIEPFFPERASVEKLLAEKGPFSFYSSVDNRKECCHIRKVEPLNRALEGMKVWITGIRADQSPNRKGMQSVEPYGDRSIVKYHPLFDLTLEEVEEYVRENNVPVNELHKKGFVSIGCEPCTRAIAPGEDFRAGRWWWEQSTGKECGLHEKQ
ncbi:MAG: phosphoadenylyl-sulfate reductase [Bacteroidales bacterium]|nr:phosphoadenylyl-sulfate reductase [Bacteroidales bacterium]